MRLQDTEAPSYRPTRRYHRTNGWRGYFVPATAVCGASDTSVWSDSPAPTADVKAELRRFQRECLRHAGIKSRTRFGRTSNLFCVKRWPCVPSADFAKAAALAVAWLREHDASLRFVHDADLDKARA